MPDPQNQADLDAVPSLDERERGVQFEVPLYCVDLSGPVVSESPDASLVLVAVPRGVIDRYAIARNGELGLAFGAIAAMNLAEAVLRSEGPLGG